jgi:hypothetical protein
VLGRPAKYSAPEEVHRLSTTRTDGDGRETP